MNTIRSWWENTGSSSYPAAKRLLITADGGGSNGSRTRLWKTELARLATETGLTITVCHLPPGTSKWNKIEHRLFSRISINWRARPLTSRGSRRRAVVVSPEFFDRALEALENAEDTRTAAVARGEQGSVSHEELMAELGL